MSTGGIVLPRQGWRGILTGDYAVTLDVATVHDGAAAVSLPKTGSWEAFQKVPAGKISVG